MYKRLLKMVPVMFCVTCVWGCASVKPYQRAYLNDPEMQLQTLPVAQFENYYESIREGSLTPGSGKSSDGCGCK